MSDSLELLHRAREQGIAVSIEAGMIRLRADSEPPLDLLKNFRKHKAELLEILTRDSQAPLSNDDQDAIKEALDERAAIQEFDGGLTRAEAERDARAAMRVYRYRLTTGLGWCTLIAPGWSLDDAERDLKERYGERFMEVAEHRVEEHQ